MLQHSADDRSTAAQALAAPFILAYCGESLGPRVDFEVDFDKDVVRKLRRYARAPRIKKVALLILAHLASSEEYEQDLLAAHHTFRSVDADGDGEISPEELQQELESHGVSAPADFNEVFASCDGNGSGKISFVEFMAASLPSNVIDERLCSEAFNVLDRDYNGLIDAEDLQLAHPSYGIDTCKEILGEADLSGKGCLDFGDFHSFMQGTSKVVREESDGTKE